ncbi:MotA/TolQ/ExbB proton channel family protein [Bacterioplanoides sp. SCSIO 12839]|uniref:MotA/TolQ/ExbB proton channel family protein n=1 Tax=Bacterioplanoides sp. SCSIO 12839 TaxID=2829569 RepID=UPI00210499A8|nr:MotA/TolQ/ExbB proton channel family protein [Bacterioplanoides sp. SCSIO 12839]UTW49913.1 MotA/TolQ/ExbB proton channel family protein [Bacterioplanoides sp. SCSIO 12839]
MNTVKKLIVSFSLLLVASVSLADSQQEELNALLNNASAYQAAEKKINAAREAAFKKDVATQKALLAKARAELKQQQTRAEQLKNTFDNNEIKLTDKEEELRLRVGNLGEMFGVVRQVATDLQTVLSDSLTSVQVSERKADLEKLAEAKELPNIAELEDLWFTLQQEMTLNGQIVSFDASVIDAQGQATQQIITRVGVFNAINESGYLTYDSELQQLGVLGRQPAVAGFIEGYLNNTSGVAPFALDPSRGALVNLTLENPDLIERVKQGGEVGFIIIALGIIGLLLAVWRLAALFSVSQSVKKQQQQLDQPENTNPLGRVLMAYGELPDNIEAEVLEAKMDEAVLRELPALERGQSIIKLFAGIAPLLGLLGTVTGMIATFQAITNFGTGDPKLMASGISQALITTVLGLVAAIPLLLAHNGVASQSKRLIQLLDEQSAGLMAQRLEKEAKKVQ